MEDHLWLKRSLRMILNGIDGNVRFYDSQWEAGLEHVDENYLGSIQIGQCSVSVRTGREVDLV
jgi:hypothetical protein